MEFFSQEKSESTSPPSAKQLASIAGRLQKVLHDYEAQAKRLKLKLSSADILSVVDNAILEAEGKGDTIRWPETTLGFFLGGFYEELIQQPSNIFEEITDERGVQIYIPLKPEIWKLCLVKFRSTLET